MTEKEKICPKAEGVTAQKLRRDLAGRTFTQVRAVSRKNAVLIPLLEKDGELSILFEVRQSGIRQGG